MRKRRARPVYDATVRYTDVDGKLVTVSAKITTRGNSRLALCDFPPLRLDFKRKVAKETLFAGQEKLKLVTRCKRTRAYAGYLQAEFIIYRAYNLLTDNSFRVRMLEIDYLNDSGGVYRQSDVGFFLEDKRSVAARTGLDNIKIKNLRPDSLDARSLNRYSVFQYLVGNTDWAVQAGAGDDDCCHNGILLGEEGSDGDWIPVPYDFDQAGMINAEYALPAEGFPIRSVRRRLYRGFCLSNPILDDTIAEFLTIETELADLLESAELGSRPYRSATRYMEEFFRIITDPARVDKEMRKKCR